jgi:YVTN family beta-propeller protein
VIATATDTVVATINVSSAVPSFGGVAVTPDGSKVYVALTATSTVAVIATASNTVTATIGSLFAQPIAFGKFIQPLPNFAGTPGQSNCSSASLSALTQKYGGLGAAAAAFGLTVKGMQETIGKFCGG